MESSTRQTRAPRAAVRNVTLAVAYAILCALLLTSCKREAAPVSPPEETATVSESVSATASEPEQETSSGMAGDISSQTPGGAETPLSTGRPAHEVPLPDKQDLAGLWERIDGSTATIPLTQALYDHINAGDWPPVHYTTPAAYERLIEGWADLIFVTYPSDNEFAAAGRNGVELEIVPVVKDALVFLINADNPVADVSRAQLRDIYTGKVTGWGSLGGLNEDIVPYQRSVDSGSQTLFLRLLMEGTEPMKPPSEWVTETMGSLVEAVSYYDNSRNALGFSMFYYVNNMYGNSRFKLLSVDGVAPSRDTIMDGKYPLEDCYYAVMRKDTPADSPARQLVGWLLGDSGQELAAQAGYIPLRRLDNAPAGAAIDPVYLGDVEKSAGTGGTVLKPDDSDVVTGNIRRPLSDMFYDGFNYIKFINEEIIAQLDRLENEDFRFTWGDDRLIRPFAGIPNDYPNFEIIRSETYCSLVISFPNGNPFFKPIRDSANSMVFYIALTEDLSPYGVGRRSFTVSYDFAGKLLPHVNLFTLQLDFKDNPDVSDRINAALRKWVEGFPGGEDTVSLLESFTAWYGNFSDNDAWAYGLQPSYGMWQDYLSVNYCLQTYDGPSANMPMVYSICFDIRTGKQVDLAGLVPSFLDYSNAYCFTPADFDSLEPYGYPHQESLPQGYVPGEGSVITDAWVMYGNLCIYITEPGGRVLQAMFW